MRLGRSAARARVGVRTLTRDPRVQALMIPVGAAILGWSYLGVTALRAGDSRYIDVTPLSTAFAVAAGTAIASGVIAVMRSREVSVGARFALAVGSLIFAVLAVFSIGLPILPIALLLLGFAVRRLLRRPSPSAVRAALGGAVAAVGAIAYLLVLIQPAMAECRINGGGTSSGGLFGPMSLSSGGYSTPTGESGGYIDEGDRIAYFTCRDGRLTDFHRVSLPDGQWVVTTQPAAAVGCPVMIVFRVRPPAGDNGFPAGGFDFSATCLTCSEPRPVVSGHAIPTGARTPSASRTFAAQVVFPQAGSWHTSPYDAPIEVR
jgi:hypothetical protein